MLAAPADHKRGQGGVQALLVVEFLHRCFFRRPRVPTKHAGIKPSNNLVPREPALCPIVRQVAIEIAQSELLERNVQGSVIPLAKADKRKQSALDELREELAIAREKLVEAVSQRSRENVLTPLRNKVGEILEKIEKLYSAERRRR
jgi:hypothetical protein